MQNFFTHGFQNLRFSFKWQSLFNFSNSFTSTRINNNHHFDTECYNYYNTHSSVPINIVRENENIDFDNDLSFEKGCEIVKYIKTGSKGSKGLGYASSETLKAMKDNLGSISKDYSKLFINFCILNNIKVREWNVTDKITSSVNHVFNEIYCSEYDKWILIDVMEALYFIDSYKKFPLSAVEYIDLLSANQSHKIRTINILSGKDDEGLRTEEQIQKMYFNPSNFFCLLVNYKVNMVGALQVISRLFPLSWCQLIQTVSSGSANYVFYVNAYNEYTIKSEFNRLHQPKNTLPLSYISHATLPSYSYN